MSESPAIKDLIARYTDLKMTQILQSAGCNALHSVQARLCRWLLQTRDRADSDTLALTQEFLSEMLGVNRTTVTVLARALQDEGLINYRRGKVALIDRPGWKNGSANVMRQSGGRRMCSFPQTEALA